MSEMSILQRTVASFLEGAGIEAPVHARLLDLASEVGELSKETLEATNYARPSVRQTVRPASWETPSSPSSASPTVPAWTWRRLWTEL
jgi:hypothetical protein